MKVKASLCGAVTIATLLLGLPMAGAQVKPGDFITVENAAKVKDLVSPGVYYKVQRGMTMKIVPAERVEWPPPYKEATEKYSAQVRLSSDHRSVAGYVAGQPFPFVDANDPYAAEKIVWNNAFRPISTDDYDLRFYDCASEYGGYHRPYQPIYYMQVGHYAGYALVGRTEVEPLPIDPDFLRTGRYWLSGLYPTLAPQEARGSGFIRYRYADPNRGDDEWGWSPGQRRVRRINEDFLSSSPGAMVGDPDHFMGFIAKTEEYDYKLLGEKPMLASVHAEHSPGIRCATDGGASACPEAWEMRNVYVLEATPAARPDSRGAPGQDGALHRLRDVVRALRRQLRPPRPALPEQHLLARLSRSAGARRQGRDLSVQARIRGRLCADRRAGRSLDHVLPAVGGNSRARVLVYQHELGRSEFFHRRGAGEKRALVKSMRNSQLQLMRPARGTGENPGLGSVGNSLEIGEVGQ